MTNGKGASRYDVHKISGFFYPPSNLSAFGSDLYHRINAICLSTFAFPRTPSLPLLMWTSYLEAPKCNAAPFSSKAEQEQGSFFVALIMMHSENTTEIRFIALVPSKLKNECKANSNPPRRSSWPPCPR